MQDYLLVKGKRFLIILKAKYFRPKILKQNLNQQCLIQLILFFQKIAHDEKNINTELFVKHFRYQNSNIFN